MKHQLGVLGSQCYNITEQRTDYTKKVIISDEVLNWLKMHDTYVQKDGTSVFVVNKVEYVYLGLQFDLPPTEKEGESKNRKNNLATEIKCG